MGACALKAGKSKVFKAMTWKGEARLPLPALGGELRFRSVRGRGISKERIKGKQRAGLVLDQAHEGSPSVIEPTITMANGSVSCLT